MSGRVARPSTLTPARSSVVHPCYHAGRTRIGRHKGAGGPCVWKLEFLRNHSLEGVPG